MNDLLDRRRFVVRSAGLGVLAATAGIAAPAPAQARFRLFDSTRFAGKPDDLAACGLEVIRTVYAGEFWPPGERRSVPDLDYIEDALVPKLAAENRDRLVLDIEHWELEDIDKLIAIVQLMRGLMPGVRMGYYSILPAQEYRAFQPGRERRLDGYAQKNRQWAPLADAVDDLYPSFYTFYDDPDGWLRMADGVVAAAKAIGKPVYPFVWPQYHDSSDALGLQMIDGEFWSRQLDKLRSSGCDGAVIWGTRAPGGRDADGRIVRLPWDPAAPWWLQTRAFAQAAGLATEGCR